MRQSPRTKGRKHRTANRKTRQKIEAIEASGLTPLDYMLAVMRETRASPARGDAMAIAAAPLVHPPITPLAIDNLRLIAQLLAEIVKSDADPEKRAA
jgi:hypothetical protein